ncbi:hypothetical protein Poly30_47190 [Planctomycetes bacterium Poly30]|uniref:Cytochrome c domain-containing protein n=1 Tax=Saltatorellus ferox TaxID=2528018 RepID=A0A518EYK1_9BACT|nr:hypothetical protein Poly30_47190 [Planctomycetes bacterium Poly30]
MFVASILSLALGFQEPAWAEPPISYGVRAASDVVSQLDAEIAAGERTFRPGGEPLDLEALLDALQIPIASQVTIFSSPSLQARRITPRHPRALYFNDEVYLGFVPGGNLIEVMAIDPHEGITFYSMDRKAEKPRFERETHRCLQCHAPSHSGGLPAFLLRSLHPEANGDPNFAAGSHYVDPATPFEDRWGGWYVTGQVGQMGHLGNQTIEPGQARLGPKNERYLSLAKLCDTNAYPTDTSDIVALLVLEHQTYVHNVLAGAAYEARRALDYQRVFNEALGEPEGTPVASTTSRLANAATLVVDALIGIHEEPLPGPVGARSPFAEVFESSATRDAQGRSLRDLDLESRLFRYPLSYLIDSTGVRSLPEPLAALVWTRLSELFFEPLGADDRRKYGGRIDEASRRAVVEILASTGGASFRSPVR